MGHYASEMMDDEEAKDLFEFYPAEEDLPDLTTENLIHNIARANRAEAELRQIHSKLREFSRLLNGGTPRLL